MDFSSMLRRAKAEVRCSHGSVEENGETFLPLTSIASEEFFNLLQNGYDQDPDRQLLVVDLREREMFATGRVRGASNVTTVEQAENVWQSLRNIAKAATRYLRIVCYDFQPSKNGSEAPHDDRLDILRRPHGGIRSIAYLKRGFEDFRLRYPFLILGDGDSNDAGARARAFMSYPSEIIPSRLYLGSLLHACNLDCIKRLNITSLLDLTPNGLLASSADQTSGDTSTVNVASRLGNISRENFFHCPVPPSGFEDEKHLLRCVEHIEKVLSAAESKLMVYCVNGKDISACIIAAYLSVKNAWDATRAVLEVTRRKRSVAISRMNMARLISLPRSSARSIAVKETLPADVVPPEMTPKRNAHGEGDDALISRILRRSLVTARLPRPHTFAESSQHLSWERDAANLIGKHSTPENTLNNMLSIKRGSMYNEGDAHAKILEIAKDILCDPTEETFPPPSISDLCDALNLVMMLLVSLGDGSSAFVEGKNLGDLLHRTWDMSGDKIKGDQASRSNWIACLMRAAQIAQMNRSRIHSEGELLKTVEQMCCRTMKVFADKLSDASSTPDSQLHCLEGELRHLCMTLVVSSRDLDSILEDEDEGRPSFDERCQTYVSNIAKVINCAFKNFPSTSTSFYDGKDVERESRDDLPACLSDCIRPMLAVSGLLRGSAVS